MTDFYNVYMHLQCIYASVNYIIIDLGNGVLPQTIAWTNLPVGN